MPRVAVVVLGDVGHSPRMKYHCISLAERGVDVDFVGYRGSAPHRRLVDNERVTIRYLSACPQIPSVFGLIFKLIWQTLTLAYSLCVALQKPDVILLQNPPGLPALLVCWTAAKIRRSTFLVDWHNYTWSIFSLRYRRTSAFVRFVEWFEYSTGRRADGGFCVTETMRDELRTKSVENVRTHYDRPSDLFRPLKDDEKERFLTSLSSEMKEFRQLVADKRQRPTVIVVSSTSWTADENFDILLSALKFYDDADDQLPLLYAVITGKGPLKEFYLDKAERLQLKKVKILTPWLKADDYPKFLACADVGVSLHSSSSGVDLPMKVVDMQGCRLPVLALKFRCIGELVDDGVNGYLFDDEQQLFERLKNLFRKYPTNENFLRLKNACATDERGRRTWDDAWNDTVWPVISSYL